MCIIHEQISIIPFSLRNGLADEGIFKRKVQQRACITLSSADASSSTRKPAAYVVVDRAAFHSSLQRTWCLFLFWFSLTGNNKHQEISILHSFACWEKRVSLANLCGEETAKEKKRRSII